MGLLDQGREGRGVGGGGEGGGVPAADESGGAGDVSEGGAGEVRGGIPSRGVEVRVEDLSQPRRHLRQRNVLKRRLAVIIGYRTRACYQARRGEGLVEVVLEEVG